MLLRNWLGYGAALLLVGACGDDDGEVADTGPVADAAEADAGDGGDVVGPANFSTPESGMVFFERIVSAEGGNMLFGKITVTLVEPLPAAQPPAPGTCIDAWFETSEYWPAKWPDDAVSLDAGDVTIQSDGLDPFVGTPRSFRDGDEPPRDFLSRQNDLAVAEQIAGAQVSDIMGEGDAVFDVSVAGGEYPATTWADSLYVPSLPTLTPAPDQPIDLVNGVNEDGELILTYESGDNTNLPEGWMPMNFVGFAKAPENALPGELYSTKVCLSLTDTITVPAETVAELRAEGAVGLVRGQLTHNIIYMDEEDPEAGRFDMVGLNCYINSIAPEEL